MCSRVSVSNHDREIGKSVDTDILKLSEWLGCEIVEFKVRVDHVHVVISIPPRVPVSTYMGTIKSEIAIKIFKSYPVLKKKPYRGDHFWAGGYFVNTVRIDEDMIKRYVKYQEDEERKEEQDGRDFTRMNLGI